MISSFVLVRGCQQVGGMLGGNISLLCRTVLQGLCSLHLVDKNLHQASTTWLQATKQELEQESWSRDGGGDEGVGRVS